MISGIFGSKFTIKCRPGSTQTRWELTTLPRPSRYRFEGWVLAGRQLVRKDGVKKDGEREGVRDEGKGREGSCLGKGGGVREKEGTGKGRAGRK